MIDNVVQRLEFENLIKERRKNTLLQNSKSNLLKVINKRKRNMTPLGNVGRQLERSKREIKRKRMRVSMNFNGKRSRKE